MAKRTKKRTTGDDMDKCRAVRALVGDRVGGTAAEQTADAAFLSIFHPNLSAADRAELLADMADNK